MYKVLRASSLTLLLASFTLSACGGGNNPAGPSANTGNIPNLATRPSAQASQLKKVRLTGTVFNSLSGAPVEKAEIQIQVLETASAPANPGASRPPGNNRNNNPDPIPTPPPNNLNVPGVATPPPFPGSSATPAVGATPIPPGGTAIPPGEVQPTMPPPGDLPPADGLPDVRLPGADAVAMSYSATGAAGRDSFQLAQNATPAPSGDEKPNLFRTDSNNKGKFFLNDVPDGRYQLTVSAPGFRTLTLTETSATGMEIPLTPLDGSESIDVVGMVLSPTETPVSEAIVSPSFPLGEAVGVPATTNQLGEFVLPDVSYGRHTFVAFTLDEQQQIRQLGFLKDVPVSDKSLKVKGTSMGPYEGTPAPTPSADASTRENLIEGVEKLLVDPTASPEASPGAEASPAAGPELAPEPAPETSPAVEASASPIVEVSPVEENEETVKDDKSFNLIEAVTELVTGEKPKAGDGEQVYPVIPLRSVLNEFVLAGSVELPEDYTIKSVEVYLTLPAAAKGEVPHEAYLFSQTLRAPASGSAPAATPAPSEADPKASASPKSSRSNRNKDSKASGSGSKEPVKFRLELPNLDKNHSYHLQLTAVKAGGEISYHHLYNLDEPDEELSASFLAAPAGIEIEGEEVNAVPPVPGFKWDAVAGADLYHVTLEGGTGAARRIVWEAWTKETEITYPLSARTQRLREQQSYTFSVEAIKGLRPASNDQKKQYALPAYRSIWTDLARLTHPPFEVVE